MVLSDFKNPIPHDASNLSAFAVWLPRLSGGRRSTALHPPAQAVQIWPGAPPRLASAFLPCARIILGAFPCALAEGISGLSHTLPAQSWNPPFQKPDQGILASRSGTWWLETIWTLHSWVRVLDCPWKTKRNFHGYAFPLYRKMWHLIPKCLVFVGMNSYF